MAEYFVTIYDFASEWPKTADPQKVEAENLLSAAHLFIDQPLVYHGRIEDLAAEVKRFEGTSVAKRVIFYYKP